MPLGISVGHGFILALFWAVDFKYVTGYYPCKYGLENLYLQLEHYYVLDPDAIVAAR